MTEFVYNFSGKAIARLSFEYKYYEWNRIVNVGGYMYKLLSFTWTKRCWKQKHATNMSNTKWLRKCRDRKFPVALNGGRCMFSVNALNRTFLKSPKYWAHPISLSANRRQNIDRMLVMWCGGIFQRQYTWNARNIATWKWNTMTGSDSNILF